MALYLAQVRGFKYGDEIRTSSTFMAMPEKVDAVLETTEPVRALARSLADARSVLFLGRHVGYPVALEGALKLKELAYMHAEGFAAGELKHGPIALIEPGLPVVVVVPSPRGRGVLHDKIVSNIQEVQARGARTIVLAEGDEAVAPYADDLIRIPPDADAVAATGGDGAAAGVRLEMAMAKATTSTSRATWRSRSRSSRCCGWPTHGCGTAGSLTVSTTTCSSCARPVRCTTRICGITARPSGTRSPPTCAPGNCSPTHSCTRTPPGTTSPPGPDR